MALLRALILGLCAAALGVACSCAPPGPDLCYHLKANMLAFVGRPVSIEARGRSAQRVTFRIEEGLWGVERLDSVTVDVPKSLMLDKTAPKFVLAGRPSSYWAKQNPGVYLVDEECCQYGLLLPSDHAWAHEFRGNVRDRKVAKMQMELKSSWLRIADSIITLRGASRSWRGISREYPIPAHLGPGDYDVEIYRPHFGLVAGEGRVSILPGACTTHRIDAEPASTISGVIVQPPGLEDQMLRYSLEGAVDLESNALEMALLQIRQAWQSWTGWGAPARERVHYSVEPDQNGRFRVAALPGRYRLSAMSGDRHAPAKSAPLLPKIYSPWVIDEAGAQEIEVRPGSQVKVKV